MLSGLRRPARRTGARQAFTLVELLTVVAIIAILAVILFPAFARARENARRASCQSNMKQIATAVLQYVQDNDEHMPSQNSADVDDYSAPNAPQNWYATIQPYTKSWEVFRCPSARPYPAASVAPVGNSDTAYYMNGVIASDPMTNTGRNIASIPEPASVIQMQEHALRTLRAALRPRVYATGYNLFIYWIYDKDYSSLHFGGGNLLFADGHVKWRLQSSLCASDYGLATPPSGPACGINTSATYATACPAKF